MDQQTITMFILGVLVGGFIVMLLWISSPGGVTVDVFSERIDETRIQELNITPSVLVASDSSGRTIATTGEKGTPSSFVDEYGNERDLVCYTSVYCIDQTPCPPCDEEECVDNGERCGYWPGETGTLAANLQTEGKDYGECCPPYECYEGYCRPPQEEECVDYGELCGMVQDPSIATHVSYIDYGECCEPYVCVDNRCGKETEDCVPTGETCGRMQDPSIATHVAYIDYGECCPPDECVGNVCTPPEEEECVDYGEACGYLTYVTGATQMEEFLGECCEPYVCIDNVCSRETEECVEEGEMCEYGPNYATVTAPPGTTWYGYCCDPLSCVEGLCQVYCEDTGGPCKTDNDCCEGFCADGQCVDCKTSGSCSPGADMCCEGYRCWEFECEPEETCEDEGERCDRDSECCGDLLCINGYCAEETECGEEGDTCGLGVVCCNGLYCSENDVCVECADIGETCGGYAAPGTECCPGGFCYMGTCQEETSYLCTDTENGPDYYSWGSATGEYEGDYDTYEDYCLNDNTVVDYYCLVNNEYAPIESGMVTCPSGCSQGACN